MITHFYISVTGVIAGDGVTARILIEALLPTGYTRTESQSLPEWEGRSMGVRGQERKELYRYLTFGLLTLLVSTSLAVAVFGGAFEDAVAAYDRGDYATAIRWIKPLAEQGNAETQFILGLMYDNGRGVAQDHAMAVKWYRKAAEQGIAKAQFNLGVSYEDGQGVPQNYMLAYMWFDVASSALEGEGRERAIKNRNAVASKLTLEQIADAQLLAREWKPKEGVR